MTIAKAGKATKQRRSLSGTQGWLQIYTADEAYYGRHMCHCSIGNDLSEIRRALLEHKRGGRTALQKYYSNPTSYTADQYLQARFDAARRCLLGRNVKLAGNSDQKGIMALPDPGALVGQKGRWYCDKYRSPFGAIVRNGPDAKAGDWPTK